MALRVWEGGWLAWLGLGGSLEVMLQCLIGALHCPAWSRESPSGAGADNVQGPLSPLSGLSESGHAANMVKRIYCQGAIKRLKQFTKIPSMCTYLIVSVLKEDKNIWRLSQCLTRKIVIIYFPFLLKVKTLRVRKQTDVSPRRADHIFFTDQFAKVNTLFRVRPMGLASLWVFWQTFYYLAFTLVMRPRPGPSSDLR